MTQAHLIAGGRWNGAAISPALETGGSVEPRTTATPLLLPPPPGAAFPLCVSPSAVSSAHQSYTASPSGTASSSSSLSSSTTTTPPAGMGRPCMQHPPMRPGCWRPDAVETSPYHCRGRGPQGAVGQWCAAPRSGCQPPLECAQTSPRRSAGAWGSIQPLDTPTRFEDAGPSCFPKLSSIGVGVVSPRRNSAARPSPPRIMADDDEAALDGRLQRGRPHRRTLLAVHTTASGAVSQCWGRPEWLRHGWPLPGSVLLVHMGHGVVRGDNKLRFRESFDHTIQRRQSIETRPSEDRNRLNPC